MSPIKLVLNSALENIPKIQRFMWENKIWCVSKAVFLSKNRIWCNNTLPLFGLNMSFLCLKIHQYYSSIMQQIHYRLCTTKPWENSLNILANIQLNMERNLVKPVLNRLAYTIHVSKTCSIFCNRWPEHIAQKRIWLRNIFTGMCWRYLFDTVMLSQSSSMSGKMMVSDYPSSSSQGKC